MRVICIDYLTMIPKKLNFKSLKLIFFIITFFNVLSSSSQSRYLDEVYQEVRTRTYTYADTLQMDFYDVEMDTVSKKPTLILMHGGGFSVGQRNGGDEKGLSTYFAKRGYNVASIDYRLPLKGKSFGCTYDTSLKINVYREAIADLSKAIHYLINFPENFKVDSQRIILVGSSAGAETILNYVWMEQDYRFKDVPFPDAKIKGVVSISGAVLDADAIRSDTKLPSLFIHGKADKNIPYSTGAHHNCKPQDIGYLKLDGPRTIINRLKALNGVYQVYYNVTGGHEWASLGYEFPDLINEFLTNSVLGRKKIQDFEKISSPKSSIRK